MARILILGATSAIARGAAYSFASRGDSLILAGRDEAELARLASDIHLRHMTAVEFSLIDINDTASHLAHIDSIELTAPIDGVLCAVGYLPDGETMRHNEEALNVITRNFTGPVSLLNLFADRFEHRKHGFIIGIGSVAGDRGRQSNYMYGAAKGAFALYLAGLRNRLYAAGVQVLTVKPGFVDTRMTFGLPGLFLVADPGMIGQKIVRALEKQRNEIYLPWFWYYIMILIRHIPEQIFKRLKL